MRIALINSYVTIPSKGAESIFLMKMAEAYAYHGHEVDLFVSNNKPDIAISDYYSFYGVSPTFTIKRTPLLPGGYGKMLSLSLWTGLRLKRGNYDLIHARSLTPAWFAACYLGLPVVLEIHGKPPEEGKPSKFFYQLLQSGRLKMIIAITNQLASFVREKYKLTIPVIAAHDGVNKRDIAPELEATDWRQKMGLSHLFGKYLAVYTGHLYKGRGIELIIEIAASLPDYYFLIVGGKENDVAYYKEMAKGSSNISFTGFATPAEIINYQKAADVLLMPYADHLFIAGGGVKDPIGASPMKMFEYMATGKPIVASTLSILKEVMQDGYNGLLVPYNEPESWVQTLKDLALNPEKGKRLGEQAKRDVMEYTWEQRTQNILIEFLKITN